MGSACLAIDAISPGGRIQRDICIAEYPHICRLRLEVDIIYMTVTLAGKPLQMRQIVVGDKGP